MLSRWALTHWTDRPSDWVSDGTDFYSLRDLFTLLALNLGDGGDEMNPNTTELPNAVHGPLSAVDAATEIALSAKEIIVLAGQLAPDFTSGGEWQVTPNAMLQPVYQTAEGTITAAQLLYGMATVFAANYAGTPLEAVVLPATRAMPVTYDLLQDIG